MADVELTIKGLDELQRKLEELPRKVAQRAIRTALKKAATIMEMMMSRLAPRRTGLLSQDFDFKTTMRSSDLAGSAYIGPKKDPVYPGSSVKPRKGRKGGQRHVITVARFLEFGTSKMAARPFMRPAFQAVKQEMLDTIIDEIKQELK